MLHAFFVIIGVTSLINVYSDHVRDGCFGRLLYMAAAITCLAGFLHPSGVAAVTLIGIFAMLNVRNVVIRHIRSFKHAKHQR